MKQALFFSLTFFSCLNFLSAQLQATTKDGRKVVLKEDHTWEFLDAKKTSDSGVDLGDCDFERNDVDEFTGAKTKILKKVLLGKFKGHRLTGGISSIGESYAIFLNFTADLGCLTKESFAILKFSNGETVEIKNFNNIDCGDSPSFIGYMDDAVNLFKESKLEKVRLSMSDLYADIDIVNPEYFSTGIYCLE